MPSGPTIGIGIGGVFGRGDDGFRGRGGYGSEWGGGLTYDEPRYYTVYDANDAYFWEWEGETDIRLVLVFQPLSGADGATSPLARFTQDWAFRQRKS